MADEYRQFGRVEDAAAVNTVLAKLQIAFGAGDFARAAPHLVGYGERKTVIIHQAAKTVLGQHLQSQFQPRGTCVSRGAKRGADLLQCVAIAEGDVSYEFSYISHAYIYGTCREKGSFLGSYRDGAVGAWAAWSMANDGLVRNKDVGDDDQLDNLAVKWGYSGVPADVKKLGRQHLVTGVAQVRSTAEVRDSVCSLKPVTCASTVGFEPFRRDANGVVPRGGVWPHQMVVTGYRDDRNEFLIDQSWGENQPGGPIGNLDIPSSSFWIVEADMAAIVRQNDCWALAGLNGWTVPKMRWYA